MFMTEILFCVFHNDRSWSWKLNNKLQLDREDVLKKKQTGKKDRAGRRENKIKNRAMGQTNESIRNDVETQFCSMSRWDLSYAFFFKLISLSMIRFQRINLKVLWAVFSSIDNLLSTGDHRLCFQLFLHSETQQRTCLELYGALHHTTGQKSDKATLHFCRYAGFKHVNSMNSLHGILWTSKCLSADWLSLFWSPTSLPL